MNATTDAKHLAVCPNCGGSQARATIALGFAVHVCDCGTSFFDAETTLTRDPWLPNTSEAKQAHACPDCNRELSRCWCADLGPVGGMRYPHTTTPCAGLSDAEREEYEAIDAQIERDGNPDREHDSI